MQYLKDCLAKWNIDIDDRKLSLFERYYELIVSWNEKINLTTVTEKDDVIIRHFVDSLAIMKYIDIANKAILDVGTGAGFPGIPVSIMSPSCHVVLLDSLNKRIMFLNEVICELGLSDVKTVHGRAEDIAFDDDYREKFDIVCSRAVANMSTLSEYCLPFVRLNGFFVSYKSADISDELNGSLKAISTLGGKLNRIEEFSLPDSDMKRTLIFTDKCHNTDSRFPRRAGKPSRNPL